MIGCCLPGSRLKKIVVPLGLATVGTAVCYPTQTVGVLKVLAIYSHLIFKAFI